MKLKKFNPETTPQGRILNSVAITFAKGGKISFNQYAKHIGIQEGTKVYLAQDEDRPKEWYLVVGEGFTVKQNDRHLHFSSLAIVHTIWRSLGAYSTCRFRIALDPVEGTDNTYAIFTHTNLLDK